MAASQEAKAADYRAEAQRIRRVAATVTGEAIRLQMLKIASDYEKLAEMIETDRNTMLKTGLRAVTEIFQKIGSSTIIQPCTSAWKPLSCNLAILRKPELINHHARKMAGLALRAANSVRQHSKRWVSNSAVGRKSC
jgi:hypothetical protein